MLKGQKLYNELERLILRSGAKQHPLTPTAMHEELGDDVRSRGTITSQLANMKKRHPYLHFVKQIDTGKVSAVGHMITEHGYWIDRSTPSETYGSARLTMDAEERAAKRGKRKSSPYPDSMSTDERRKVQKSQRIADVLQKRVDPSVRVDFYQLGELLGVGASAARNYGTSVCKHQRFVHRAYIQDASGQWKMFYWYNESTQNSEYGTNQSAPRMIVQSDGSLVRETWAGTTDIVPSVPEPPRTLATRDYQRELKVQITEEQFKTARRTINLFKRACGNTVSLTIDENGELQAERLVRQRYD